MLLMTPVNASHPRFSVYRSENSVPCKTGKVIIQRIEWCNGVKDCPDGSDEDQCILPTTLNAKDSQEPKQSDQCPYNMGICVTNNMCIPIQWFCDGHKDCPNGFDEEECSSTEKNLEHHSSDIIFLPGEYDFEKYDDDDNDLDYFFTNGSSNGNYQIVHRIIFTLTWLAMVNILFALYEH